MHAACDVKKKIIVPLSLIFQEVAIKVKVSTVTLLVTASHCRYSLGHKNVQLILMFIVIKVHFQYPLSFEPNVHEAYYQFPVTIRRL